MAGKPIRLGKAASELNVGLPTLVDFLEKKGVIIDSNPNSRLEPEQYEILLDEFGNNFVNDDRAEYETNVKESNSKIREPEEPEIHTIPGFILKTDELKKEKINNKLSIGFSNFKRFEKFPMIDLKAINFFVGPNNAGKSTAVKAYRMVSEYLKNIGEYFKLNSTWEDSANKWLSEDTMTFEHFLGEYYLTVTLLKDEKVKNESGTTEAKVLHLTLKNTKINVIIDIIFPQERLLFRMINKDEIKSNNISIDLNDELTSLNLEIEKYGNVRNSEYLKLVDRRNKLAHSLSFSENIDKKVFEKDKYVEVFLNKSKNIIEEYSLENLMELIQRNIGFEIQRIQKEISDLKNIDHSFDNGLDKNDDTSLQIQDFQVKIQQLNEILEDKRLKNFFKDFSDRVNAEEIIYLGANLTKQSSLFLIQDIENQLGQAIHSFSRLKEIKSETSEKDEEFVFLKKWMGIFEILSGENKKNDLANDFEILPINGIAYEFNLLLDYSGSKTSLANMGMGSIQVMTLLLRLATLIRKSKTENKLYLVVVEEPELNLHPNFQSKLCDLFFEVNKEYPNIRFVIETHSEYMIRKSQLIGIKNNLFIDEILNPFNVIYFDIKSGPYKLSNFENGSFKREFGSGFIDVVDDIAMDIFLERQKSKK
jgi:predicted ATPase